MKYCDKCKVTLTGDPRSCPLCQGVLEAQGGEPDFYPQVETVYHRHSRYLKLVIFLLVSISVIAVSVNLMLPETGAWSFLFALASTAIWVWLVVAIRRRGNILKKITDQVVISCAIALLWDYLSGWKGWSANYFIPGLFICAMASTWVLVRVLRLPPADYLVYIALLMLFGAIPAVFLITNLIHVPYVAYACLACSLISLARLLIYEGAVLSDELKRRLHL